MKNRILTMVFCGLLGACATAPRVHGNANPADQGANATILASYEHKHLLLGGLDHQVFIGGIDHEDFGGINNHQPQLGLGVYPDRVEVRPGLHSLTMFHAYLGHRASECLWVRAEAGKTYIVTAQLGNESGRFILRESVSGEEVGGDCGSAPTE